MVLFDPQAVIFVVLALASFSAPYSALLHGRTFYVTPRRSVDQGTDNAGPPRARARARCVRAHVFYCSKQDARARCEEVDTGISGPWPI